MPWLREYEAFGHLMERVITKIVEKCRSTEEICTLCGKPLSQCDLLSPYDFVA